MNRRFLTLTIGALLAGTVSVAAAADLNVPTDYSTIQAALDAASPGDNVILAPGTYSGPGNVNLTFGGKAITLKGTPGHDYESIIDGGDMYQAMVFNTEGDNTVIHGLVIQHCYTPDSGGAIIVNNCGPTIEFCRFMSNNANGGDFMGGGAIAGFYAAPHIQYCNFNFNHETADANGGAIMLFRSMARINNCTFTGNTCGQHGAAIAANQGGSGAVFQCEFNSNTSAVGGGAVAGCTVYESSFYGNSAGAEVPRTNDPNVPAIANCRFFNNAGPGVAVTFHARDAVIENCQFTHNHGAGMLFNTDAQATVRNCTFSQNDMPTGRFTAHPAGAAYFYDTSVGTFVNCIMYGDQAPEISDEFAGTPIASSYSVSYSDISGHYRGTHNFEADPQFVDAANDDVHLRPSSTCINAGLNSSAAIYHSPDVNYARDLMNYPRISATTVDLGAYEFQVANVKKIALSRSQVVGGSNISALCTVTTVAPLNFDIDVPISISGIGSSASVPDHVTIPAGQTTATFPVLHHSVATVTSGVITANWYWSPKYATLTLTPNPLTNYTLAATWAFGGLTVKGTVTLTTPVGEDTPVTLASDNSASMVPATVVIHSGQKSATFNVMTVDVPTPVDTNVTASQFTVSKSLPLRVVPNSLVSVKVAPNSVIGGSATTVTGTVTLGAPVATDTVVTLYSTSSVASVPASVTIPAGAKQVSFDVHHLKVRLTQTASIVATYNGVSQASTLTVKRQ